MNEQVYTCTVKEVGLKLEFIATFFRICRFGNIAADHGRRVMNQWVNGLLKLSSKSCNILFAFLFYVRIYDPLPVDPEFTMTRS